MKQKRSMVIGAMLVAIPLLVSINAYAGDINGNEQSVLGVVQGTFEYEGVSYKAAPGYIGQASAHLSDDGVDMTAAQASQAISEIYANVKTGIAEGYIIPVESVGGGTDKQPSETPSEGKETPDKTPEKEPEKEPEKVPEEEPEEEPEKKPMIITNGSGMIEAIDQDGNSLFVAESVVKNTGFQFSAVFVVVGIMIIGIGMCFMFIMKKQLLAHGHES